MYILRLDDSYNVETEFVTLVGNGLGYDCKDGKVEYMS